MCFGTSSLNHIEKKSFSDIISVPTITDITENQVGSSCNFFIPEFNQVKSDRLLEWKVWLAFTASVLAARKSVGLGEVMKVMTKLLSLQDSY